MNITNMHIHSKYSWDSKMEISRIATILRQEGVRYAAITDHVEFRVETIEDVISKLKIRNLEIDQINRQYQDFTLLKGIEVSEPHLYPRRMEKLQDLELDYILGSIHRMKRNAKTYCKKQEICKKYYEDVLKMVEFGYIDAVGHLDYIKRYYMGLDYGSSSQVQEVLSAIVSNHLLLEINTSATRRVESGTFPGLLKLKEYSSIGGKHVVIGTDAHREEELLDHLIDVHDTAKELKLDIGIFRDRKFERI